MACDQVRNFWNIPVEWMPLKSSSKHDKLSCADEDSWSEDEQEPVVLDQTWRGDPDSEADSIDSDREDPLK